METKHRTIMKKKRLILVFILTIIICFITIILVMPYFQTGGKFDNNYSGKDLEKNYFDKEKEIHSLGYYFNSLNSDYTGISFSYSGRNDRFDFDFAKYNPQTKNVKHLGWDASHLRLQSGEMDSVLQEIGWTKKELEILLSKLKAANCIGVYKQPFKGKPVKITYREGGTLGIAEYSYLLFEKPLTDSLKVIWEAKEGYRVVNDSTVFEFGYPL